MLEHFNREGSKIIARVCRPASRVGMRHFVHVTTLAQGDFRILKMLFVGIAVGSAWYPRRMPSA
jgi:hypothetical protein